MQSLQHWFKHTNLLKQWIHLCVCNLKEWLLMRIEEARMVFDTTETRDVAGWNAMISAYSQHGNTEASISLFFDMLMHVQAPDKITLIAVLSVCADQVAIAFGTLIHHYIVSCSAKLELEIGNSLLNMYGRGGSLEDALEVFCAMSDHNLVSWSSLIILYAQHDLMEEALKLFEQMLAAGVTPDKVIFLCAIPLCASEAALELGRKMHHSAVCCGFHKDDVCATAFLTMYSKCGSFEESKRMFHLLEIRNLVSWNSLIAAHAHHGHGAKAILCLSYMSYHGLAPDECTFYSILSACSHAGLLEEGLWYFANMVQQSLVVPRVEHFNCIIDLFGRAGQLEAVDLVLNRMGLQPSDTSWVTMLSACRVHLDVIQGENAVAELLDASWMDLTPTLLLSNIYHAKRCDDY
ncbi:hypothetical protein KP509_11G080200 [Ceratopteris richardii]|uniref:Pentatricopeptide repeat-containing protein n=1 Tax=Ceratopteris richardii TaxID=49495 RepID=A0A8T2TXA1_CERRI|nr:hypothetical protein KP509_11G080200 [Ceratopteris richardii]